MDGSDLTLLVSDAGKSPDAEGVPLHEFFRVAALHDELRRRVGDVRVIHGGLREAPPTGVLLLVCLSVDAAIADAAPETRARVIWLNADRAARRDLTRYGFLAAVDALAFLAWVRSRAANQRAGLLVRADVARALAGSTADADAPDYAHVAAPGSRDVLAQVLECAAAALGSPPPPPDRPNDARVLPDFPLGHVLAPGDGARRYRLTRRLSGTPDRGFYEAQQIDAGERRAYVSLGTRQTVPWAHKLAELELPADGFAPILGVARLTYEGAEYDALLEANPGGVPLPELLPGPLSTARAARILLPVATWVAGAHRQGRVIVGLRPEAILAAIQRTDPDDSQYLPRWATLRPQATGLAPRCEQFLRTAERPCYGVGPAFDHLYQAPEVLAMRAAGPAADVFSLAAILARLVGGADPFPGDTLIARLSAVMTGAWSRAQIPAELVETLDRALAPDPAARPPLASLHAELAALARRPPHA